LTQFVLDASVALGWLVDYPTPALAARVKRLLAQGDRGLVPALFHLEVANGLAVAEKRGVLTINEVDRCIADVELVLASAVETRNDLVNLRQAAALGRSFNLSPYDAVYLHLAQMMGIALATLDQKLRAAAERVGVSTFR
jgi:predicted nucleic acid-binding protein